MFVPVTMLSDDPDAEPLHHRHHAFGKALVGLVVGVGEQRHLDVLAAGGTGREVDEAVAVGVLQPGLGEFRLGAVER